MQSGISPVVATILLVAIAVMASVSVWFWVSPYGAKPALAETTVTSLTVVNVYSNSSDTGCNSIDIKNTGRSPISGLTLYIRDYHTGKPAGSNGTDPQYNSFVNITSLAGGSSSLFPITGYGIAGGSTSTERNITDTAVSVSSMAIGDADNDGTIDIVIGLYSTTNEVRMYTNVSGGWREKNISDLPNYVYSLDVGDADNDGLNEVAVAVGTSATNELRLYDNVSGGWRETNISDAPLGIMGISIGDANNDGSSEILAGLVETSYEVRMYENKTGRWVETNISDESNTVSTVIAADADNDGLNELVASTWDAAGGTNYVYMYKNVSASWGKTIIATVPDNINRRAMQVDDADNDGLNEVVVGLYESTNELRMYKNQSGSWVERDIANFSVNIYTVSIWNFLGFGNKIMVGTDSTTNEVRTYENVSGGWREANVSNVPINLLSSAVADVNADSLEELVIGLEATTNELRLYQLNSTVAAANSSIPIGVYFLRTSAPGYSDQTFTCN